MSKKLSKQNIINFLARKHYHPTSCDDIAYSQIGDLLTIVLIEGEYHSTLIYKGNRRMAEVLSQSGGVKSWDKFKVIEKPNQNEGQSDE